MNHSLSHVTVLDLSRILAGPWAGQLLADLGADVIKVERPGMGDDTRSWGPPFLRGTAGEDSADAAYFLCANRNKKSVTVDITTSEGQSIVRDLARDVDVVLENFKVDGLKAYGLDYESLKAINPRLVYCSITGFGQTGPYASRPGYDFLIQAMAGLMSITGREAGQAGAGPQKSGVAVTDLLTGLYATIGILAALTHRERTGVGQHIDVALMDVQVACLANQAMNYLVGGKVPQRLGNAHPNVVPYQDFPTADGFMIIAVGNDTQFNRLCAELGLADLATDPRFTTNQQRVANRIALVDRLCTVTRTRSTAHWLAALESAGVPCGPINAIDAVFADPQVRARDMQIELPHPVAGKVSLVANPLRFSETPVAYRSAPPLLGEHTREVLAERLALSASRIDELAAKGII
ncbi:MAG: CoA transferase [Hydrocarboniphaga sp.]|uniref:CaiB/BaiF CoA transferase family protein n=1 Tax=Hydrocarboniphaga sp. TaxID=2033016 RepID=UPI002635E4A6|nr:CaiB/BaiF CoA-transferase family protein [Hydrocarboniphaga sp.]MDB5968739.1 CoA transferase [Hydrocarboniphaga sp.]